LVTPPSPSPLIQLDDKPNTAFQRRAHYATGTSQRKQNFPRLKAPRGKKQNSAWRGSFNPLALVVATRKDASGVLHNDKEMFYE
jgi:hypothetical protein